MLVWSLGCLEDFKDLRPVQNLCYIATNYVKCDHGYMSVSVTNINFFFIIQFLTDSHASALQHAYSGMK